MKRIILLAGCIFLTVTAANASIAKSGTNKKWNCNEPISFVERGIEFLVFPNGEFDFNTSPQNSQVNYFYKTAGRRSIGVQVNIPVNYGVSIEHDGFGRVRRVGNVFINYDNRDRVNRIGNVYMKYNHFALTYVGGVQIVYNHCGEIINRVGRINECVDYYAYNNNHLDDNYKYREVAYRGSNRGNHYGHYNKKRK